MAVPTSGSRAGITWTRHSEAPTHVPDDKNEQLLAQILEVQRAHLEEYKRVTSESLDIQRRSIETQVRHLRVYRRIVIVGSVIVGGLLAYAVWLGSLIARPY